MPDLWLTVSRYLASTKAVLAPSDAPAERLEEELPGLSAEQSLANRRQFERTERLVKQFMLHEGPQLQRDLKEYANKCQNWVSRPTLIWTGRPVMTTPASREAATTATN